MAKSNASRQVGAHHASATARYLAPDVARGIALLGIIMANTTTGWFSIWPVNFSTSQVIPSRLEQACVVFEAVFLHNRGMPMFTTLVGVGVALIVQRELARGKSLTQIRWLLARRSVGLIVLGVLHDALIYSSDVLLVYGSMTLILMWLITLSNRVLKVIIIALVAFSAVTALPALIESILSPPMERMVGVLPAYALPESLSSFGYRLEESLFIVLVSPLAAPWVLPLMLIGFMWGRAGVFGDVDAHRRLLSHWAIAALAVMICVGLPLGLEAAGILSAGWINFFFAIDSLFAVVIGPGILAMITLAVQPVQRRQATAGVPWWMMPVVALGRRSLSGYLVQHIIMAAVIETVPAETLGSLERSEFLLMAFLIWLATLTMATLLELVRLPGPFEWIHRWLTYGPAWKDRAQLQK